MPAAAALHRASFDDALPWLAGLHTPEEDRAFFNEHVTVRSEVWGAFDGGELVGMIVFRAGWIDQLYVAPVRQHARIGTSLLGIAQAGSDRIHLWTFQRNEAARCFYDARGFILIRQTDGSDNAEREPDALYVWSRELSP